MKNIFSPPTIIKEWEWDGNIKCKTVLPIVQENSKCVNIELDQEALLFRLIRLKKKQNNDSQSKQPKQPTEQNKSQEPLPSFLPKPIYNMSQKELKQSLKSLGLQTTGNRDELARRLENFVNGGKKA